jgi:alpha-glucosidase
MSEITPQNAEWWQKGVIYQIYPRSFQDSNGDGIGDLDGITGRLPYLVDLGVDVIWLSPFYTSPMADFGYDVADYTDVDPIFGDLAAFDRLIGRAHALGLKMIVDFVPNHSSDQHPWFIESRASRDNPKRDWYVWRDPAPNGGPPNNWLSVFGGSAWELDETTGQYYLHSFLKEQPDVNWRNPGLRAAMLDAMRFWLERGVDGFRFDVAHYIMKDPEFRDNPARERVEGFVFKDMGGYDALVHLYSKAHADVHDVYREVRALLNQYSTSENPRFAVGEIHEFDWAVWSRYYGASNDELHMPFNFALLGRPWDAQVFRTIVDGLEAAIPPGAWPNYVISNHDEHRVVTRYGYDGARAAMMILLTLRGTPTMYYGDEIAMQNAEIPPEMEQDPWGKRVPGLGLGRDPERTPMQWDAGPNAGFSREGVATWLPINHADVATINVEAQRADPTSMLHLTRRLLHLRRETHALSIGSYRACDGVPDDCFVYERAYADQRVLVAVNFADDDRIVSVPGGGTGTVLLNTLLDRDGAVDLAEIHLRPREGAIIGL